MVCNDIGGLLMSIPLSYIGSRPGVSKPLYMGVSLLVVALGNLMFTIPHFAAPRYSDTLPKIITQYNYNNQSESFSEICHGQVIITL